MSSPHRQGGADDLGSLSVLRGVLRLIALGRQFHPGLPMFRMPIHIPLSKFAMLAIPLL